MARPRGLRERSTEVEGKLWYRLRNRQLANAKFRRQHMLSPFIADFVCIERKLIIELDGGQHADRTERDKARTKYLETLGYRVLRFWNPEVVSNMEGVLETIYAALNAPHPSPLPASGAREMIAERESQDAR